MVVVTATATNATGTFTLSTGTTGSFNTGIFSSVTGTISATGIYYVGLGVIVSNGAGIIISNLEVTAFLNGSGANQSLVTWADDRLFASNDVEVGNSRVALLSAGDTITVRYTYSTSGTGSASSFSSLMHIQQLNAI